ncbi:MAG: DUF4145 domain-containing protein [Planctomycetes bacterium]|nr:DUF4145 domain-containing protein [Planctomycetota bacterium]
MDKGQTQKLAAFVDRLIEEGNALKTKTFSPPGNWLSGPPVYVDLEGFAGWTAKCRQLAHMLGEHAAPWRATLEGGSNNSIEATLSTLGTLTGIREALQADLLVRVEDLVRADAFADLLEQAEYLLTEGYHIAAAVLGRAVLEEHLRNWCNREACTPSKKRPTLSDLIQALYKTKHVDKLSMKGLESMTAAGNAAAHNEPGFDNSTAARLLRDVREFLSRTGRV